MSKGQFLAANRAAQRRPRRHADNFRVLQRSNIVHEAGNAHLAHLVFAEILNRADPPQLKQRKLSASDKGEQGKEGERAFQGLNPKRNG